MGLFSFIGKAIGTVVKVATGDIGGAVKGIAGMVSGGKKSSSSQQPYIQAPQTSLADLRAASAASKSSMPSASDVKVAKTAGTPNLPGSDLLLDDPWKPARDWYESLGGDPEVAKNINKDRMPF